MKQTGRKSAASLSIAPVQEVNRLHAPSYLQPEHKSIWMEIVNAKPADFFGREHIPMLEALCRHIVEAQKIADMIDRFDSKFEPDELEAGLRVLEKLHKMHRVQTQAQENLMRAMRLTHQAIYRANKAPAVGGGKRRPWLRNGEKAD
jgi:hypothetical protein